MLSMPAPSEGALGSTELPLALSEHAKPMPIQPKRELCKAIDVRFDADVGIFLRALLYCSMS